MLKVSHLQCPVLTFLPLFGAHAREVGPPAHCSQIVGQTQCSRRLQRLVIRGLSSTTGGLRHRSSLSQATRSTLIEMSRLAGAFLLLCLHAGFAYGKEHGIVRRAWDVVDVLWGVARVHCETKGSFFSAVSCYSLRVCSISVAKRNADVWVNETGKMERERELSEKRAKFQREERIRESVCLVYTYIGLFFCTPIDISLWGTSRLISLQRSLIKYQSWISTLLCTVSDRNSQRFFPMRSQRICWENLFFFFY